MLIPNPNCCRPPAGVTDNEVRGFLCPRCQAAFDRQCISNSLGETDMQFVTNDVPSTGEEPLRLGVLNFDPAEQTGPARSSRGRNPFSPSDPNPGRLADGAEHPFPNPDYGNNDPAAGYGIRPIPGFPTRSRLADGEETNDDTFQDEDGMLLRSKTARADAVFLEAQPADPGLLTPQARRALGLVPLPGFGA
jgi:hypothetical protein